MRRPYVIAHRGASGYEYENSRAAFRRAVMLDADGVELDVHATRDGAIVVHHDAEIPGFGPGKPVREAVVIVSALAPRTTEPARYTLTVRPR